MVGSNPGEDLNRILFSFVELIEKRLLMCQVQVKNKELHLTLYVSNVLNVLDSDVTVHMEHLSNLLSHPLWSLWW